MSFVNRRYGFYRRSSANEYCGEVDAAYFIFSEDADRVRVEFDHRFRDESESTHYTFHGERVE